MFKGCRSAEVDVAILPPAFHPHIPVVHELAWQKQGLFTWQILQWLNPSNDYQNQIMPMRGLQFLIFIVVKSVFTKVDSRPRFRGHSSSVFCLMLSFIMVAIIFHRVLSKVRCPTSLVRHHFAMRTDIVVSDPSKGSQSLEDLARCIRKRLRILVKPFHSPFHLSLLLCGEQLISRTSQRLLPYEGIAPLKLVLPWVAVEQWVPFIVADGCNIHHSSRIPHLNLGMEIKTRTHHKWVIVNYHDLCRMCSSPRGDSPH